MQFLILFSLSLQSKKKLPDELVAQLVEQYTFNVWALGSSPSQFTKSLRKCGGFFFIKIVCLQRFN
jgi:hypothetical protein